MIYEQIAHNRRVSIIICVIFVVVVTALGLVLGEIWRVPWLGLAVAMGISLGSVYGAYYNSDRIVLTMSRARPLQKSEHPFLFHAVEGLAIAAGIPVPRCYVIADSAPNAFATGRDPEHGVLCVTTGLLGKMNRLELEGVLAHEMSHIKNYDTRLQTLVVVLVGTTVLLSDWILWSLFWGGRGRRRSRNGGGQATAVLLVIGLVLALLAPLIAQLLRLAISRKREFLADASAALLTRYPDGLADALEKLAADPEPLAAANKATAHLYIVNPLKSGIGRSLFSTHPPIEERVRRLRAM